MEVCILQGKSITPEMPGTCSECELLYETCSPIILSGYVSGGECDLDYCCDCPCIGMCGV